MSKRGDFEILSDIKEAIRRIEVYIKNIDYSKFLKNIKTQDAVVRNLEIIGEAAKNLSDNVKKDCPNIPWKKLAGIRDRLIHKYFGVNYDIVWAISKDELPDIASEIEKTLKNNKSQ